MNKSHIILNPLPWPMKEKVGEFTILEKDMNSEAWGHFIFSWATSLRVRSVVQMRENAWDIYHIKRLTTNSKSNPTYEPLWIYIFNIFKPPWVEFPVICVQKVRVIKTQGW